MYKLIFLDIDGTIAMPRQRPSRATVEAIQTARSNGHRVFISTDRIETNVAKDVRSIGFDGGIYNAGARVVVNSTEIMNRPMPVELVKQVTDFMEMGKLVYMLESIYHTFIIKNGELSPIDLERFYASVEPYHILKERQHGLQQKWTPEHRKYPVYKVNFLTESRSTAEWLYEKLYAVAKVVRSDTLTSNMSLTIGEVSDWSINKGVALNCICRHLGCQRR